MGSWGVAMRDVYGALIVALVAGCGDNWTVEQAFDAAPGDAPPSVARSAICLDGASGIGTAVGVDELVAPSAATIELWYRAVAGVPSVWQSLVDVHPVTYVGGDYPRVGLGIADAPDVNMTPLTGRVLEVVVDARGGPQGQLNARGFDIDATLAGFDETAWHHYAVVWDGTAARAFVDGVELTSAHQRDGAEGASLASAFGASFVGTYGPLHLSLGYFARDQIRYAAAGLADLRVSDAARYTGSFTPAFPATSDASTVLLVPVDEGTGALSRDVAGAGHDLTWSGGFAWSDFEQPCP